MASLHRLFSIVCFIKGMLVVPGWLPCTSTGSGTALLWSSSMCSGRATSAALCWESCHNFSFLTSDYYSQPQLVFNFHFFYCRIPDILFSNRYFYFWIPDIVKQGESSEVAVKTIKSARLDAQVTNSSNTHSVNDYLPWEYLGDNAHWPFPKM